MPDPTPLTPEAAQALAARVWDRQAPSSRWQETPRCCCTHAEGGHRCPDAWDLILKAQIHALAGDDPALTATRRLYTAHLVDAGLSPPGSDAWPDRCTMTIAEDPRCPQCGGA